MILYAIELNFTNKAYHGIIIIMMNNKHFLILFFLFIGMTGLAAAELNGTYDKDYKVQTEFNRISEESVVRVKSGATYIMSDAIVDGKIIVEKGAKFIAEKDGAGYLVFKRGSHIEGVDLYYKLRISGVDEIIRKIPMTLDEIWACGNDELIEWVCTIEFCYSSELQGWVSTGPSHLQNPFNEDLTMYLKDTYEEDHKVTTQGNVIKAGDTLRVSKGSTFTMTDAIVQGSIIVEPGASFIAVRDNAGYLKFEKGSHIEGVDLYYKVRVSDNLMFTRKIPITLDEVWETGDANLIEIVKEMEFSYSTELKGWVTRNEIRFMNPFNENLYEDYDIVLTKSGTQVLEFECNSLTVKNKAKVVLQSIPDYWGSKINKSITVQSGASLTASATNGHRLQLKKGITVKGLPLYIKFNNDFVSVDKFIPELWTDTAFGDKEYNTIYYEPSVKGWVFEEMLDNYSMTTALREKIEKQQKKKKK